MPFIGCSYILHSQAPGSTGLIAQVPQCGYVFFVFCSLACGHAAGPPRLCAGTTGGVLYQPAGHQHEVSGHMTAWWWSCDYICWSCDFIELVTWWESITLRADCGVNGPRSRQLLESRFHSFSSSSLQSPDWTNWLVLQLKFWMVYLGHVTIST